MSNTKHFCAELKQNVKAWENMIIPAKDKKTVMARNQVVKLFKDTFGLSRTRVPGVYYSKKLEAIIAETGDFVEIDFTEDALDDYAKDIHQR